MMQNSESVCAKSIDCVGIQIDAVLGIGMVFDTDESKALKQSRQQNKRLEELLKQRVSKKEVAHHENVVAGLKKQLAAKTSELQEFKEATCLTVSPKNHRFRPK